MKSNKKYLTDKYGNVITNLKHASSNKILSNLITNSGIKSISQNDLRRLNCTPSPNKYHTQLVKKIPITERNKIQNYTGDTDRTKKLTSREITTTTEF